MTRLCVAPGCGPRQPRRTAGYVCEWCTRRVADALDAMPRHYLDLRAELPRAVRAPLAEMVSGTSTPQPPLRLDILDAMADTQRMLCGWEDNVRGRHVLTGRRTDIREYPAVALAARFLGAYVGQILHEPGIAAPFTADIIGYRSRLSHLTGWGQLRHRLPAPCPACNERALIRYDGDSYVRCVACRDAWPEHEYAHLVLVLTEGKSGVA